MNECHYSFANDAWRGELVQAYSFRFTETPDFTQAEDHVTTAVNPSHREGYDNISLLSPEAYRAGVSARLRCAFDGVSEPSRGWDRHCYQPSGSGLYDRCQGSKDGEHDACSRAGLCGELQLSAVP